MVAEEVDGTRLRVHGDGRRWIVVLRLGTPSEYGRLVDVFRQECLEPGRRGELVDDIAAIETAVRSVTQADQPAATQT